MNTGTVLMLGASSQVGVFALPMLVARGYRVLALSRQAPPPTFPTWPQVTWVRELPRPGAQGGAPDALISAGPLSLAADCLQTYPSISRLAVTSSTSTISKRASADAQERRQMAAMVAAEQALQERAARQAARLVLLRPTLVYGCGLDRNLSLLAGLVSRYGLCPISSRAGGLRQPLHAEDLALALVEALQRPPGGGLVSALCGGSTLSYRAMVEALFAGLGKPPRLLRLPPALLATLVSAWGLASGAAINRQMVLRQAVDLVFDDQQARSALAVQPRRFEPTPDDFRLPTARRWQQLSAPP